MNDLSVHLKPIGVIESSFKERFGTPRQPGMVTESKGLIRLNKSLNLASALEGLETFSHIWVIFLFHKNTNGVLKNKVHPPRLKGAKVGLFATRTPHRPNPIGLSALKLESVDFVNGLIAVSGLDIIDGSPILDIKPYIPFADKIESANSGWVENHGVDQLSVEFSPESDEQISASRNPAQLKKMITETLVLDPRPEFYKGTKENPNPYMDTYGFCIEDFNVVYQVHEQTAQVLRLEQVRNETASRGKSL